LEHPYIVPLFDFWREPDGAFLVMRFFPFSLYDYLQRGESLTLEETARMLDQIASALTIAHRSRVIHHDLKPENILLDQDGNAYLTDFGIASHLSRDKNLDTERGFTGSVEYAAPELLQGQPATVQSDIYSLGYVIHRVLSGKPVVSEKSVNRWINHHLSEPLPPNERIPARVFETLQKATAKDSTQRYASVIEFAAGFRAAISGQLPISESIDTTLKILVNPYKGLRAFEESDVNDFFGREALTGHLLARLAEETSFNRFLAVVGPSGSGKSSAVKAGLLPRLRRGELPGSEQWFVAEMTPGDQPFEKLAAALFSVAINPPPDVVTQLQASRDGLATVLAAILPPGQELVIVMDQFEELFILTHSDTETALFLDSLYTAVTAANSRLRLIITLRADFYDRPLVYGDFAELMRTRTEVVVPLSSQEFERAILGPAEGMGLKVEPPLVAAIIADLRGEPGALPLLQYALTELFERREGQTLTLKAYQASGGALQALARRAEELYQGMSEHIQQLAQQVFLRLVTLGEGIEDTRRRVLFSELNAIVPDRGALQTILDTFGKYRLITFDHDPATREPNIEIAHEALIQEWAQLRQWLDESRSDVRMQRLLAAACREWLESGQQPGFLLTGGRLIQFEEWSAASKIALTADERRFLQASLAERDRLAALEAERQAREIALERRARRRSQILAAVLAFGVIGALILSAIAFDEREKAQSAQRDSDQNAKLFQDTALLSYSQLSLYRDHDADLAITLALEAHKVGSLPEQEYRALSEAAYAPGTRRVYVGHTDWVYRLDLNQDGTRVLSGSKDMTMRLWNVETGELLRTFPADDPATTDIAEGHSKDVVGVAFSPDERLAASTSFDNTARIWDIETGQTLRILGEVGDNTALYVWDVAFSPEGRILATGADTIRLWDVETGDLLVTFPADDPNTEAREGHTRLIRGVVFSPDGRYLISSSDDTYALVWDVETVKVIRQFKHGGIVFHAHLSPDGTSLVTATQDKMFYLWNFETGELRLTGKGHTAHVYSAWFSPDQTMILTVSQDKSIRLWNPETGAETRRFIGHLERVYDVAFLPNGGQFITSSYDGTLRLWDIQTDESIRKLEGHEKTVYQPIFNADGTRIVSPSSDKTVRLWNVETGELLRTYGPDNPDTPDVLEGHSDLAINVAFSPDETRILSVGYDDIALLWDVETGELLRTYGPDNPETPDVVEGHMISSDPTYSLWAVAFSPDGQTFYTSGFDQNNAILRRDVETGAIIQQYTGHTLGIIDIALTRDGQHFLTASWDKTIKLWDAETGEVIHSYEGHTDWVWDVAWSPDEQTFLSASADKTAILWDVATGREIRRFVGHIDGVLAVTFNHEGNLAISGGRDNIAILWDVQTGELLRRFTGHTGWIRGLQYSPAADVFATADGDTTIRLWPVQTYDQLKQWAEQNRYVRDLTCPERKLFRVEPYCEEP
jgi:WD40 repeat protein